MVSLEGLLAPALCVNVNYVDGVSLTCGNTSSKRTQVWTFVAVADGQGNQRSCPREVPEYIGHH